MLDGYLVFVYSRGYGNGWKDYKGSRETLDEAIAWGEDVAELIYEPVVQIVDTETEKIVKTFAPRGCGGDG